MPVNDRVRAIVAASCCALSSVGLASSPPKIPLFLDAYNRNSGFPTSGVAFTGATRRFDDLSATSKIGQGPSPRKVSLELLKSDKTILDPGGRNLLFVFWGQFITHDLTHIPNDQSQRADIGIVDKSDPLFPNLIFARSVLDQYTSLFPKMRPEPLSYQTSFLDGSAIYSVSAPHLTLLRAEAPHSDLLKEGKPGFPPLNDKNILQENLGSQSGPSLYLVGDLRGNENPFLLSFHALFLREHNVFARSYRKTHQRLTEEQVFQETREYIGALVQKITYEEFLPALLGKDTPTCKSFDKTARPGLSVEFSTAAFRFGHSMLPTTIEMAKDKTVRLSELFFSPNQFGTEQQLQDLFKAMLHNHAEAIDTRIASSVQNTLFPAANESRGLDLAALNIQRGRDHELPLMGAVVDKLGKAKIFEDRLNAQASLNSKVKALYGSWRNMDLWPGLLVEDSLYLPKLGPTHSALLKLEFESICSSDPAFYKWNSRLSGFSKERLKKAHLSSLITDQIAGTSVPNKVFYAK